MTDDRTRCAHEPCTCVVSGTAQYCCAGCAADASDAAATSDDATCLCGHSGCGASVQESLAEG